MTTLHSTFMMNKLGGFFKFLTLHRRGVLVFVLFGTVAFASGATKIQSSLVLAELVPYGHEYLQLQARMAQVFGSGMSGVAIVLKSRQGNIFNATFLTKLKRLTEEVTLWNEVYRSLTISLASPAVKVINAMGKGEIAVESLMWPRLPQSREELARLKQNVFSSPAYHGSLVSKDGTAALLFTEFKDTVPYDKAFSLLRGLVTEYTDAYTSVHIIGYPMMMGWIYSYQNQILKVLAASLTLLVLILFLVMGWPGMLPPLGFGLMSTGLALGFVGWIQINLSPLSYVLAFLAVARLVSHSTQVTNRYREEFGRSGGDPQDACYQTMRVMFLPCGAGAVIDAAGFLALLVAQIGLIKQIAVIMVFWMLTVALAGLLTPVICSYLPFLRNSGKGINAPITHWLARLCASLARITMGPAQNIILALTVAVLGVAAWQATKLSIGDTTPGSPLLWPDHGYNQDQVTINRLFDASSENMVLYYEGVPESVYDPAVLHTFEAFDRHMQTTLPDVYKSSSSIIDLVKMVNEVLHDGDKLWRQVPREKQLLNSIMGYVRHSSGRSATSRFIDTNMEQSQITLFFTDHISNNLARIKYAAYDFFKNHPKRTAQGEFKLAGGRIGFELALNDEIKWAQVTIDSLVFGTIFLMGTIFLWSFTGGLMLTIPLVLANLMAFAYMAGTGIGLSINTLPVVAVGAGVGLDFGLYIYSRCIEEYPRQAGLGEAILASIRTSGVAVAVTGLTMIVPMMVWCFLSDLKFQAQMGIFLSLVLTANVILALTLHPLLIYLIRPNFITKNRAQTC
ncbi:MAG: MMPL family transporter [Deltaproteobacteria bacterium]|nr:MMPL family transporter [Deltaproteobacteria bacterium]